jgi:general L-amino acid transport system permease protein
MMNATIFQPIAPRPAPVNTEGRWPGSRRNLLGDWKTTLATIVIGGLLLWYVPQI